MKLQTCSACQDLPTLPFWCKSHYPFWLIMQIRKKGGWNLKKILSSETTEPISTNLCWNDPFKIVSVSVVLYPIWPPLLKIEISSNGQNCSILSQKVPKFELYKHNNELFNIYYRNFYELWTFAYFDRLCKLEKRGDEIKNKNSPLKLLSQSQPNFAEMILSKLCPSVPSYIQNGRHY